MPVATPVSAPLHCHSSLPLCVLFPAPGVFLLLYILTQNLLKIFYMLDMIQELEAQRHDPSVAPSGRDMQSLKGPQAWDT